MPYIFLIPCKVALIRLSIITMYLNDNTDNIHNVFVHMYCFLYPYSVSYILSSFMKNIPHTSSELTFYMFICISYILSRTISKIWVKLHIQICLVYYIIAIFIMILTITALYGYSTVEAICLWMYLHVKLSLQWFNTITFYHNIIDSIKKRVSS